MMNNQKDPSRTPNSAFNLTGRTREDKGGRGLAERLSGEGDRGRTQPQPPL